MRRRPIAWIAITSIGVALMTAAIAADQSWFDRHFLPSFFLPRRWYVGIYEVIRAIGVMLGALVAISSRGIAARLNMRTAFRVLPIAAAAALAFGASEFVLRRVHMRPAEWLLPEEEPRRQSDPRLGWTFVPSRVGSSRVAGRVVEYAIDAAGYRVRRVDEPVDRGRTAIVFVGESMMFGEGLTWEESVPAQVGAMLGVESANLAVHGFSTDQAYLRLEAELPGFRHPLAVVSLFMTALFGRNLDDDRPHLGPGLTWIPAEQHARLVSLAGLLVPYRRDVTVEQGLAMTREVLRATVNLARARGAAPLIVVPQFGTEEPIERALRERIFSATELPCIFIEIASTWRLSWDRHPNAAAAHVMAEAIAERVRSEMARLKPDTTGERLSGFQ